MLLFIGFRDSFTSYCSLHVMVLRESFTNYCRLHVVRLGFLPFITSYTSLLLAAHFQAIPAAFYGS